MRTERDRVIIIGGLRSGDIKLKLATLFWRWHGLKPEVLPIKWENGVDFESKLSGLTQRVDELTGKKRILVVGTSAGGSAALNLLAERPEQIAGAVNVCGRLRTGTHTGRSGFEARTATSPAFAQSVIMWEERERALAADIRRKIMTICPPWDELVPADTVAVEGARNIRIPMPEHVLSITAALTILSGPLIRFLTDPGLSNRGETDL